MSENGQAHCEDEESMIEKSFVPLVPDVTYRRTKIAGTRFALNSNNKGGVHIAAIAFFLAYGAGSITDVVSAVRSGQFFTGHNQYGDCCAPFIRRGVIIFLTSFSLLSYCVH